MLRAVVVSSLIVAGCYGPSAQVGVSCATSGTCPAGQTCDPGTLVCVGPGGVAVDGSPRIDGTEPDGPTDAMTVDGAPIDAAVPRRHWGTIQPLTTLNSTDDETDPTISGNGLLIYFASDRGHAGQHDIYRAARASIDAAFDSPVVSSLLQTGKDEVGSDLSQDGLSLYFTRGDNNASPDVKRATRNSPNSSFQNVKDQVGLTSGLADYNPATCNNEQLAYVDRPATAGTVGNRVIWEYKPTNGDDEWVLVRSLDELETAQQETGITLTDNCLTAIFASDRDGGVLHLYTASRPSATAPFGSPELLTELSTLGSYQADADLSSDGTLLVFKAGDDLYQARAEP